MPLVIYRNQCWGLQYPPKRTAQMRISLQKVMRKLGGQDFLFPPSAGPSTRPCTRFANLAFKASRVGSSHAPSYFLLVRNDTVDASRKTCA